MKKAIGLIAVAFMFQGCAVTAATVLAASATGVSVAEDVFGIATKYHQLKKEWQAEQNATKDVK